MKRILLALTLVFAGVTAIVLLSLQYPGDVAVTVGEWRVEAGLWVVVTALVAAWLALGLLLRLLVSLWRLPGRLFAGHQSYYKRRTSRRLTDALLAYVAGDYAEAYKPLLEIAKTPGTSAQRAACLLAARCALRVGDNDGARKVLELAAQWRPAGHAEAMVGAELAARGELPTQAVRQLIELLGKQPGNVRAVELLAGLCERDEHCMEQAAGTLLQPPSRRALSHRPAFCRRIETRATASLLARAAAAGDAAQLRRTWEDALRRPGFVPGRALLLEYAGLLERAGAAGDAARHLEKIIEDGWGEDAIRQYGILRGGDLSRRIPNVQRWLARRPDDAALLLCMARLYKQSGEPDRGRGFLKKSLAVKPGYDAWLVENLYDEPSQIK